MVSKIRKKGKKIQTHPLPSEHVVRLFGRCAALETRPDSRGHRCLAVKRAEDLEHVEDTVREVTEAHLHRGLGVSEPFHILPPLVLHANVGLLELAPFVSHRSAPLHNVLHNEIVLPDLDEDRHERTAL
jgi:hypothetical protein